MGVLGSRESVGERRRFKPLGRGSIWGIETRAPLVEASQKLAVELGFDRLSTFGIGREHPAWFWLSVLRQLIHRGLLEQRLTENALLRLTEAARPLLRGDQPLLLSTPRPPLREASSKPKAEVPFADRALFNQLRILRRELAERDEVPPYVVFNDATLQEMARIRPQSLSELRQISGVGAVKLERYGEAFVAQLRLATGQ